MTQTRTGGDVRARGRRWRGGAAGVGAVALALGAGAAALIAAAGAGRAGGAAPARPTSDVVVAERGDFDVTTTATGELRARNQEEIRNQLEADTTIVEIIPEGSIVKAGQVLVRLNTEAIQTRIEEESLQLESARAQLVEAEEAYQIQLSENESNRRAGELKLALARLDLDQWRKGEVESKRLEHAHAIDRAEKDEERLGEKHERSVGLEKNGYYSKDALKQDQLAWEQAKNTLAKARLDRDVYEQYQFPKDERKKRSDVDEAEAELERARRQNASRLASKEADLKNKRQALAIRQQKFDKYREQLDQAVVKAPRDGLVVYSTSIDGGYRWGGDDGPLQVGKKVSRNELLIVLPDTTEMLASVKVHESLAGRIRPGQPATVKIDADGERRFGGRVDSIGILAEQTSRWMDPNLREYTVKVALDMGQVLAAAGAAPPAGGPPSGAPGAVHGLKPSMRCETEIMLGRVTDALTVPIQAVFSDGPVRYVHVEEGGKFVRRPVLVGQRSDRFAEVRAGLEAGRRVLIRKPEAAEVVAGGWDPRQLEVVGLTTNEQGVVVPAAPPGGKGAAVRAGGPPGPTGAGAVAGAGPGGAETKAPAVGAPAPATPAEGGGASAAPAAAPAKS